MKPTLLTTILAAAMQFALPTPSPAQAPQSQSRIDMAFRLPSNVKHGYFVKDGVRHSAILVQQSEADQARQLLVVPQTASASSDETGIFTPDQVSEWGFDGDSSHYLSARVETATGTEWYFVEVVQDLKDGSRIVCLDRKASPSGARAYFRLEGDKTTPITTDRNDEPMWDFLSSATGYDPAAEGRFRRQRKLTPGQVRYFYGASEARNFKMFPQNRFGITASYTLMGLEDFKTPRVFYIGAFTRIPVRSNVYFQPELTWSRYSDTDTGLYVEERAGTEGDSVYELVHLPESHRSNTLTLPLTFRIVGTQSRSDWMPYGEAGIAFSWTHTNRKYLSGNKWKEGKPYSEIGALQVIIGGGVEYQISKRQIAWLGVRINHAPFFNMTHLELTAAFSLFNY